MERGGGRRGRRYLARRCPRVTLCAPTRSHIYYYSPVNPGDNLRAFEILDIRLFRYHFGCDEGYARISRNWYERDCNRMNARNGTCVWLYRHSPTLLYSGNSVSIMWKVRDEETFFFRHFERTFRIAGITRILDCYYGGVFPVFLCKNDKRTIATLHFDNGNTFSSRGSLRWLHSLHFRIFAFPLSHPRISFSFSVPAICTLVKIDIFYVMRKLCGFTII